MTDGSGTLRGEDRLSDRGLQVKKTFFSPDGQPRVIFTEDLKVVSKELYEILRAKLIKHSDRVDLFQIKQSDSGLF